uniref:Uncharacterized protein n=1 Tax=Cucumis melo TaxID=3656 RepID=A0A9I9EKE0_CUCME
MTPIAIKCVFRTYSAALEQHSSSVKMSRQAGIVKSDRVPLVASVDINAGFKQVAKAVDISGTRSRENVAVWDLFQGKRRPKIRRVEIDSVKVRVEVQSPRIIAPWGHWLSSDYEIGHSSSKNFKTALKGFLGFKCLQQCRDETFKDANVKTVTVSRSSGSNRWIMLNEDFQVWVPFGQNQGISRYSILLQLKRKIKHGHPGSIVLTSEGRLLEKRHRNHSVATRETSKSNASRWAAILHLLPNLSKCLYSSDNK